MSLIDPGLLQILCCPETRQPVREADAAVVADLNRQIAAGTLKTRAGEVVRDALDGALVREDGRVAYAVRHRLPIMLAEEAIPLTATGVA